jgi:hypothetical protein
VQAGDWQPKQLGHCAITAINAEGRPFRTMARVAPQAHSTTPTRCIDFAHHAPPDPGGIFTCDHRSDKLVPQYAMKTHIPTSNFDIGIANADEMGAYQRLSGP